MGGEEEEGGGRERERGGGGRGRERESSYGCIPLSKENNIYTYTAVTRTGYEYFYLKAWQLASYE